jgi:photosystem II oxygen-evolving enhancer protein 1
MRYRALIVAFLAICLSVLTACSEAPSATSSVPLTYDQIRNTGLANKCPQLSEMTRGTLPLEAGKTYQLVGMSKGKPPPSVRKLTISVVRC